VHWPQLRDDRRSDRDRPRRLCALCGESRHPEPGPPEPHHAGAV